MNETFGKWMHRDQQILQYIVLEADGGPVTVKEVAEDTDFPKSTVSRHLRDLAADRFLYRENSGREVCYYMDEEILEEMLESHQIMVEAYEQALDQIEVPDFSQKGGETE